jgi:hypothetical protein
MVPENQRVENIIDPYHAISSLECSLPSFC